MPQRLTVLLCCWVLLGAATARAELHRLGYIHEDLDKLAPEHQVKSIPVPLGAASHYSQKVVDLTSQMPPVGDQQQQGSCACWSCVYYHRTQIEYHERHWDLTDPNHQFSPAFVYNQVNGGGDNGSGFNNILPLICDQGVSSLVDCPYNDGDCTSWPSESAYSHALPFRTKTWAWFHTYDTTGINMIKQLLVNGSTASLAIGVWGNFDNIASYNYMYCASDREGTNRGGHMITFVGYNDTLPTHDGTGAFRMVNSWGTGWGQAGYFWMSYQAVMDSFLSGRAVGYLTDTVGYVPKLVARVQINYPARDKVGLKYTIGTRTNPLWTKTFRKWRNAKTDHPFPANNMVFDLTDGSSYIKNGQTDSIYFIAWDSTGYGDSGAVASSSVQYLDWGTIFNSGSTPLTIWDDGRVLAAGHRIWETNKDVTADWIFSPTGIVEPESSYVPRVEVRNNGQNAVTFPVRLTISTGYADTVQVTNLAHGQADTIAFLPWVVPPRCTAAVRCSTALTGDENHQNDLTTAVAWARYHDVGVTRIISPGDTVDSGFVVHPQIQVWNYGTQTEAVMATFRIPDDGYSRVSQVSIPSHQGIPITFATWVPKLVGSHMARCSLSMAGDAVPANDTMSRQVDVQVAGIAEGKSAPNGFRLELPRPSVLSRNVAVAFALPRPADVSLALYDATGALVRQLRRGNTAAGQYRLNWDGTDDEGRLVPAGVYYCRLKADDLLSTQKLVVRR
ncbi:MAG TPA: FlgD immunoglobulin-like domain containing protein [bacterium]|nr:FlgD immunoglobulin-like domain containing protein [bacterium]